MLVQIFIRQYLYQILNNLLTSIKRSVEWLVVRFGKKPENHRKGNISPISTGALWYSHWPQYQEGVKWTSEPGHWAHYGGWRHGHSDHGGNGPGVSLSQCTLSQGQTQTLQECLQWLQTVKDPAKGWWLDQRQNSSVSVQVVEL